MTPHRPRKRVGSRASGDTVNATHQQPPPPIYQAICARQRRLPAISKAIPPGDITKYRQCIQNGLATTTSFFPQIGLFRCDIELCYIMRELRTKFARQQHATGKSSSSSSCVKEEKLCSPSKAATTSKKPKSMKKTRGFPASFREPAMPRRTTAAKPSS